MALDDQGDDFFHDALPDSTSHMRLLKVLEAESGVPIRCELTSWSIEAVPPYYAISYTWGDELHTSRIIVNDRRATVRYNCEYVLRQAHAASRGQYFWIDALCIDQKSQQEKTHQVAMMGNLYEKASHVFACVGQHTDDSEFLITTIDKHSGLLSRIHKTIVNMDHQYSRFWTIDNPIPTKRLLSLRCYFVMRTEIRKRLIDAVIAFMRRSYFSRVWILQELKLASTTSFCCGTDVRSFDHLIAITMLVDYWVYEDVYISYWSPITRLGVRLLSKQTCLLRRQKVCGNKREVLHSIEPQRGCLALASGVRNTRRLAEVIDNMQHFDCVDVRDKLYGILALVDWPAGSRPDPDYSKDNFEVAITVYKLYYEHYKTCAPVHGTYVEWVRRLREIFRISLDHDSLRQAVAARYPGPQPPSIKDSGRDRLEVLSCRPRLSISGMSIAPSLASQSRKRVPKNRTKGTWYGVRLVRASTGGRSWSNPKSLHFEKKQHADDMDKIVDQDNTMFAIPPPGTRSGDWLLTSDTSASMVDYPLTIIARRSHPDTGHFTILGQACTQQGHRSNIYPYLEWEEFFPKWLPEDLFVLDWSCESRRASEHSRCVIDDWLKLRVCGPDPMSYVQGRPLEPLEPLDSRLGARRKTWRSPNPNLYMVEDEEFYDTFGPSSRDELLIDI